MTETATLSVVIPAYNEAERIVATLTPLLEQSEHLTEVIVVDNASSDDTPALIAELQAQYPKLRMLHEPKQGVSHAVRTGIAAATGSVLGRIDADTIVGPRWAQSIVNFFTNDTDHAAALGRFTYYDGPTTPLMKLAHKRIEKQFGDKGWCEYRAVVGTNMAIRTDAWKQVEPKLHPVTGIWEDCDLSIVLFKEGYKCAYLQGMEVETSGRLMTRDRKAFWQYTAQYPATLKVNDTPPAIIALSYVFVWWRRICYFGNWIPFRAYDPTTKKFSLKQLVSERESRVIPNG